MKLSPRELHKQRHPDFFSDSISEELTELADTLLDYHLGTLTTRSQEADFERFACELCSREVCPNLLPTTGPTGGGDSKADTETFPVSETLAMAWYVGMPDKAAKERWAFAISAKAAWLPKLKSDIKKIVETGRAYTQIIFVTNQTIAARKRAAEEDSLKKQYNVEVRILDRTWIIERVFKGKHTQLAIDELRISGLTKQHERTGPNDAQRIAELEVAEKQILALTIERRFSPGLVDLAFDAADICRSLEKPRGVIDGSYARLDRFALEYGTQRQQVESAYQWAWTLFWWLEDVDEFKKQYEVVEARAKDSDNVFDLERLSNLWTLLFPITADALLDSPESLWWQERTQILHENLERLTKIEDRPSVALQARTLGLIMKLTVRLKSDAVNLDDVYVELTEVINTADGLVGFPLRSLVEVLELVGNVVADSVAFDTLFDTVVDASSKREGEVRAALLILKRGKQLLDQDKLVKAIALIGQALGRLYKHETRAQIVFALALLSSAYERIGLLWAARGAALSGASIAANDFWRYGEFTTGFRACANKVKWLELRLGRITQCLAWHEVDWRTLQDEESKGIDVTSDRARDTSFDALLGRLLIRTPPAQVEYLRRLPDPLDEMDLVGAMSAVTFLLGHTEGMSFLSGRGDVDEMANKVWSLSADAPLPSEPALYEDDTVILTSKIFGCKVSVQCRNTLLCIEASESILASLESFMSTTASMGGTALQPKLSIEVSLGSTKKHLTSLSKKEKLGEPLFSVRLKKLDLKRLSTSTQQMLRSELFEVALQIFSRGFRLPNFEADLETLFRDERVSERASAFTGSIGTTRNVLGDAHPTRISQWSDPQAREYEQLRTSPWMPAMPDDPSASDESADDRESVEVARDEMSFSLEEISHENMEFVTPIRLPLWDKAGWKGVLYMMDASNQSPPLFCLIFNNAKAALQIFEGWREDFGMTDEARKLRICVVRGIDRSHPHAYRVIIGLNFDKNLPDFRHIMTLQRMHRMDATTSANLDNFIDAFNMHERFILMPALMTSGEPQILKGAYLGMYEITIRNAYEIGLGDEDSAGIQPDDDIIIPEGVTNPPVLELQAWRRKNRRGE